MDKEDFIYIGLPTQLLHQLKTPPLTEEAKEVMIKHGCMLEENPDECIVSFPEGTTRTEIFPRMMTERYHITLPNGYQLQQVYDRFREINILFYPRK